MAAPATARVDALRGARTGTTTPAYAAWLRARVSSGLLRVHRERARGVTPWSDAADSWGVRARTLHGPDEAAYEATGYRVHVTDVAWLAPHVPQVVAGLPVLDHLLQAAPALHLMGPLSELEMGPAGRNLWGAMRATDRLVTLP